CSRQQSNFDFW
nr:immunoglobulin heavy chain junction region [Macaca mulatta]